MNTGTILLSLGQASPAFAGRALDVWCVDLMRWSMSCEDSQPQPVAISEVYRRYAERIECGVPNLTVVQRKQAFLDALLDGQRIEPFASWVDLTDMAYG